MRWWFVVLPVLVGLAQPVIWEMNVRASKVIGEMEAAVLLHVVGAVVGVGWVLGGLRGQASFSGLGAVPWWAWLAGAIGVTGMAMMNRAIPAIGVSAGLGALVAAQFVASLIFEHYGLMGSEVRAVTPARLLGAALLVGGAWLLVAEPQSTVPGQDAATEAQ